MDIGEPRVSVAEECTWYRHLGPKVLHTSLNASFTHLLNIRFGFLICFSKRLDACFERTQAAEFLQARALNSSSAGHVSDQF